jgi:hypothetical protein
MMSLKEKMRKTILKTFAILSGALILASASFAQSNEVQPPKTVRKIIIRSADPLLIAMLLSGVQNYNGSPVPSQLINLSQGGFGGMNGQGGFGNSTGGSGGFGGMNGQGGFGNSSGGR